MAASTPQRRPDVLTRSSSKQQLLYDSGANTFHILNETAEFIWGLCDGHHTLEDMERELRESFDVPADLNVRDDIQRTLDSLERKGLLMQAGPEATASR